MALLADLIGESSAISGLREQVRRLLAIHGSTRRLPSVLILGETGTGKNLLARLMHEASARGQQPFVTINCAAIPDTLLEAELFGYERGAFTDARQAKPGLFQASNRGSLFLDEIGALPGALQSKLLTALEERVVRRLGGTHSEAIDIWLMSATSEDLWVATRERRFREDLYHRLSTITLSMPPLRQRGNDVVALAEYFLGCCCRDYEKPPKRLSDDAIAALRAYGWPGNVRELANLMERVTVLVDDATITADTLGLPTSAGSVRGTGPDTAADSTGALRQSVAEFERAHLLTALRSSDGNLSRAAALLGIPRNTLRYRMSKYGLQPPAPGPRGEEGREALLQSRPTLAATPGGAGRLEKRSVTFLWITLDPAPQSLPPAEGSAVFEMIREKIRAFGGSLEDEGPRGVLCAFGLTSVEDPSGTAVNAALAIRRVVERGSTGRSQIRVKAVVHVVDCWVRRGPRDCRLEPDGLEPVRADVMDLAVRFEADSILVSPSAGPLLRGRFPLAPIAEDQGRGTLQVVVQPIPPVSGKPSIAVLPFRNSTGDREQEYFGEGIAEDITAGLSRLRWVFVIARSSTLVYKTRVADVRQIATELGVRYLLTGTVRRMSDQLRVTAELVDAEAQTTIWAESYDGGLADIYDFQNRITARIVATLDARVRFAEIERAMNKRPESLDAYDCVLRALSLAHRLFTPDFSRAKELLDQAIKLDPQFSGAYGWRAWWYLLRIGEGISENPEADIQDARRSAEAALERDPDDPIALAVSGHAAALNREYDRAVRRFERSLALNPNSAFAWGLSGATFCYLGEPTVAYDRALHALRLSPFDLFAFYFDGIAGLAEMLRGRYEEAVVWAMKSRAEKPRYSANLRKLAACLAHLGRLDEAREVAREFLELQTGFTLSVFRQRYPLRDKAALEQYVEGLRKAGLPE